MSAATSHWVTCSVQSLRHHKFASLHVWTHAGRHCQGGASRHKAGWALHSAPNNAQKRGLRAHLLPNVANQRGLNHALKCGFRKSTDLLDNTKGCQTRRAPEGHMHSCVAAAHALARPFGLQGLQVLTRTQESSAPSGHFTRKSRVPFSFARVSSTAAGSTSSNRLSARAEVNISKCTYLSRRRLKYACNLRELLTPQPVKVSDYAEDF